MNSIATVRNTFALLLPVFLAGVTGPAAAQEVQAPAPQEVWFGEETAVTYSARIEGDWLVVEVQHESGWHTYAMDNVERAREATGRDRPDTELPHPDNAVTRDSAGVSLAADGPDRPVAARHPLVHVGLRGPLVLRRARRACGPRRLGPGGCAGLHRPVVRDGRCPSRSRHAERRALGRSGDPGRGGRTRRRAGGGGCVSSTARGVRRLVFSGPWTSSAAGRCRSPVSWRSWIRGATGRGR